MECLNVIMHGIALARLGKPHLAFFSNLVSGLCVHQKKFTIRKESDFVQNVVEDILAQKGTIV